MTLTRLPMEFPDFDVATLPAIPDGWEDISWHNDTCPSFQANGCVVYVDYAAEALREFQNVKRFTVQFPNETYVSSDDWAVILQTVELS